MLDHLNFWLKSSIMNGMRCRLTKLTSSFISQNRGITSSLPPKINGCLDGITVLDLSRILAGPFCTMLLADLGANVIKVEKPPNGDETRQWGPPFVHQHSAYYLSINRNKKSITIDFKKPEGLKIIKKLVAKSDIFIENYIPGKMDKMGLGYDDLHHINPGLIYCSISGFGSTGPYSKRAGFDTVGASIGGLLAVTGPEGGEVCRPGIATNDLSTGLYAHGAILAALHQRSKTGVGMKIDCNLLSSQISLLTNIASNYLNAGQKPQRRGTAHESLVPYQAFKCADGKYFTICSGSDRMFQDICRIIFPADQAQAIISNEKFTSASGRLTNRTEIIGLFKEAFSQKTMKQWVEAFEGSGTAYAPVNEIDDVFQDPQVIHNQTVLELEHKDGDTIKVIGPAVKYRPLCPSLTAYRTNMTTPPTVGQHTVEILEELGYDDDSLTQFKQDGIIV